MKKILKVALIFLCALIFALPVKADETPAEAATKIGNNYDFYEYVYKAVGAINYYHDHASFFDNSGVSQKDLDDKKESAWNEAKAAFKIPNDSTNSLQEAYENLTQNKSFTSFTSSIFKIAATKTTAPSPDDTKYKVYQSQLSNCKSLPEMLQKAANHLKNQSVSYKNLTESDTLTKRYKDLIDITLTPYSNWCDKLKDSPGIAYYLSSVLKIVSYVSLALAVILGALDFVKAITSHDDAALTKAFQSFVKRIVAVALIFMVNVIVSTVLGTVEHLPGVDTDSLEVCDIIKKGLFN